MVKLSIMLALAMSPVLAVGVQAQEPASGLPDGPAKGMVEGVCTSCHQASEILRSSGYTHAGWTKLTSTMVDLSSSPAEREQIIAYLATHSRPTRCGLPRPLLAMCRSRSRNGRCRRSASGRATRSRDRMAPFGGPANGGTSSDGSIRRQAR